MTYKYDIKFDSYDTTIEKFIVKIELGESKVFENKFKF